MKVWVVYGMHHEGELIAPQLFKNEDAAIQEACKIKADSDTVWV